MSKPPRVAVAGSLNIDYLATVERLPGAGETVSATRLVRRFGGKGANQAVAAARQGAQVALLGTVGDDDLGRAYEDRLRRERIDPSAISRTRKALTGTALIAVDASGENSIVVAPGANAYFRPSAVREHAPLIRGAQALLVQFEIPMPSIIQAAREANRAGIPLLLNPSPWHEGFPWGNLAIDTLIVNQPESEAIFRRKFENLRGGEVRALRNQLIAKGITNLVITRGAQSTLYISAETHLDVPALRVRPVDTVGAGDAFAGTLAACRAQGLSMREAILLANAAGALATLKPGAQESMPARSATRRALQRAGLKPSPR